MKLLEVIKLWILKRCFDLTIFKSTDILLVNRLNSAKLIHELQKHTRCKVVLIGGPERGVKILRQED